MTTEMVDSFIAKPQLLLLVEPKSRRDADAMAITVSQYIAADAAAMPALLSVLTQASLDQRGAIGQGLYRTVSVCGAVDQSVASRTEAAVRKISDASVTKAYRLAQAAEAAAPDVAASDPPVAVGAQAANQPMIGNPVMNNPMTLKLSDPFVMPEIR